MKKSILLVALIVLATTVFSQTTTMETKFKTIISISKKDSTVRTTTSTDPQFFSIVEYKADFLITMLDKTTLKYRTYYCYLADSELDGTLYLVNNNSKDYTTIYIYEDSVLIWNRITNHKTWYYNTTIPIIN
jgi:hypothetical protein